MRDPRRGGILILIGLFRLAKALLLIAAGLGTLRLLHPNAARTVTEWARQLPIAPGHDVIMHAVARLTHLSKHRIEELAVGAFAYAALFIVEGTGLLMRRVWAENLTIVATISFIPFEVYEIAKRPTAIRFAVLAINLAIVVYLVWRRRTSPRE